MNTYEPLIGEDISETARIMVTMANTANSAFKANFNDCVLIVNPGDKAKDIVKFYNEESNRRTAAYRKSPEAKCAELESEKRKEEAQRKHDALMRQLPNLDFTNDVTVLNWLCEFQDPSDHSGVVKHQNEVLTIFAKHGYQPSVNLGEAFNGEDRDNVARYIIGQALANLQGDVGAIHKIVHVFTASWKKKFVA